MGGMQLDLQLPPTALPLTRRYLAAQLAGDAREALRLALEQGNKRGTSVAALQLKMIAPAQREIGRLWQENCISVAQEHLATSISQLVMTHLYTHLPRGTANGRLALVARAEGETYEVGARLGADFMEMAGGELAVRASGSEADELARLCAQLCLPPSPGTPSATRAQEATP